MSRLTSGSRSARQRESRSGGRTGMGQFRRGNVVFFLIRTVTYAPTESDRGLLFRHTKTPSGE